MTEKEFGIERDEEIEDGSERCVKMVERPTCHWVEQNTLEGCKY